MTKFHVISPAQIKVYKNVVYDHDYTQIMNIYKSTISKDRPLKNIFQYMHFITERYMLLYQLLVH